MHHLGLGIREVPSACMEKTSEGRRGPHHSPMKVGGPYQYPAHLVAAHPTHTDQLGTGCMDGSTSEAFLRSDNPKVQPELRKVVLWYGVPW